MALELIIFEGGDIILLPNKFLSIDSLPKMGLGSVYFVWLWDTMSSVIEKAPYLQYILIAALIF